MHLIKYFNGLNDHLLPHACLITGFLKSIMNTSLKARVEIPSAVQGGGL
jgi:hypothetical protein